MDFIALFSKTLHLQTGDLLILNQSKANKTTSKMRSEFQGDVRNFLLSRGIILQRKYAPFNSDSVENDVSQCTKNLAQGTKFSKSVLPVRVLCFVISWIVASLLHRNTLLPSSDKTSLWYQHSYPFAEASSPTDQHPRKLCCRARVTAGTLKMALTVKALHELKVLVCCSHWICLSKTI